MLWKELKPPPASFCSSQLKNHTASLGACQEPLGVQWYKRTHTHAKPAFPSTKCLFLVVLKPSLWLPTRNSFDIFPVIQVGSQRAFWEGDEKQHGTNTAPYGKKRRHLQRMHNGWGAPLAHHPAYYLSNLLFLEEFSMRNSFERPIFPSRMIQMFSFVSASSLSLVTVTIS